MEKLKKEEVDVIGRIADRALPWYLLASEGFEKKITIFLDIANCHARSIPLRLLDLEMANDVDFVHDVLGIRKHMDRETGQMDGVFVPRYAR